MRENIAGKKYYRLTVVSFHELKGKKAYWKCKCKCGNIVYTTKWHLTSANTRSCGCYHKWKTKQVLRKRNYKHGHSVGGRTRLHSIWSNMLRRCYTKSATHYKDYGGRGITVCKEWHTFLKFKEDMGRCPSRFHTLERINNNDGYNAKNCKWIHRKFQPRNQRSNKILTYKNKSQCLAAWAEEYKVRPHTLMKRINRGWSMERALLTPSLRRT